MLKEEKQKLLQTQEEIEARENALRGNDGDLEANKFLLEIQKEMEPALKENCVFLLLAVDNSQLLNYIEMSNMMPLSKQAWTILAELRHKLLQDSEEAGNIILFVHSLSQNQQTVHAVLHFIDFSEEPVGNEFKFLKHGGFFKQIKVKSLSLNELPVSRHTQAKNLVVEGL